MGFQRRSDGTETLFQRFELKLDLGEGAFGTVYRAYDRIHGCDVALKCLTRMNAGSLARFKREFRLASELVHPNLIRLGELFEADGEWAFSMELVEGTDFLSWVRPTRTRFDEDRLRDGLLQLAGALQALHGEQLIHRDIKPKNVLVAHDGRVVLLDFGLVGSLDAEEQSSTRITLGTVAYMAPEQADGSPLTPAADLYSLGVLLYEALVGRPPFTGEVMQVLLAKYGQTPFPPRSRQADVPADLDALALDLLEKDPHRRPDLADVIERLHGRASQKSLPPPSSRACFVGRTEELAQLTECFERCRRDGFQLVLVHGEGGIGKTALIEAFMKDTQQRDSSVRLLKGRCHALEQVTYKAFDEISSQLAGLCRMHENEGPALPASTALLDRLFPAFDVLVSTPRQTARVERAELFDAVVELLTFFADERPLLIAIDDLQWTDRDSTALLVHLLEHCTAKGLLLIASARDSESGTPAVLDSLESDKTRRLRLGALTAADARQLASELSEDANAPELERMRSESRGHPLFLQELARSRGSSVDAPISLEAAFHRRALQLGSDSQRVLALVCVTGAPAPQVILAEASGLSIPALQRVLAGLRRLRFVQDAREPGHVVAFHDRLRESIVSALAADEVRAYHASLARGWERSSSPSAVRAARHYLAAREHQLAAPWLDRAIEEAFASSAFALVEELCTIRLSGCDAPLAPPRRWQLELLRTDALAYAGAFGQSAAALLKLVELADGNERRDALVRAAQRLLYAGEVKRGLEMAADACRAVGVPWPRRGAALYASVAWQKLALVRLLRSALLRSPMRGGPCPPELELQLDTLWRFLQPVWYADLVRSFDCSHRYLRLAIRAQSPRHLAQALAAHSVLETMRTPSDARGAELGKLAEKWADVSDSAEARAYVLHARMGRAQVGSRWQEAEHGLYEAMQLYRSDCPTENWLQAGARAMHMTALFVRGKLAELAKLADVWVREARSSNDAFGFAQCVVIGHGAVRHLLRDRPDLAREEIEQAMHAWRVDSYGYIHVQGMRTRDVVAAYEGATLAERRIEWDRDQPPFVVVTDLHRERRVDALLRQALADTRERMRPPPELIRELNQLLRASLPHPRELGRLYLAQVALASGDNVAARAHALHAAAELTSFGDLMVPSAARLLAAAAAAAPERHQLATALRQTLREQGWINVDRALVWLMPIFARPEFLDC